MDKAGAYGIQEKFAAYINRVLKATIIKLKTKFYTDVGGVCLLPDLYMRLKAF